MAVQNSASFYELSVTLLWTAEQFLEVAVTDSLAALPFPKVILQASIDSSKVLHALGDAVAVVVLQSSFVTGGTPGGGHVGTQESAQHEQSRERFHFCKASHGRSAKEK